MADRRENAEMESLKTEKYYHGSLPRENVEPILFTDGEFLIRYNDKDPNRGFVIAVRSTGKVRFFKINLHKDLTYFVRKEKAFRTIKELVDYYWRIGWPLAEKEGEPVVKLIDVAPRSRWECRVKDVELITKIGEGAFGEVWKARYHPPAPTPKPLPPPPPRTDTDTHNTTTRTAITAPPTRVSSNTPTVRPPPFDVAVKTCKDPSPENRGKFEKECMFQLKFKHKNIVETIGIVTSEEPMMIILEFCPRGSLLSLLQKKKDLAPARLRSYAVDAARGMAYLEGLKCIHRDVATRNCLVGGSDEVKISDFGLAKSQEKYKMLMGKVAIRWMAPESMRVGDFTAKSDVWAFGVLMWEIFSAGQDPYPGLKNAELRRMVLKEKYHMVPPEGTPSLLADMMVKCWEYAPRDRPTFAQIVEKLERGEVTPNSKPKP